MAFNLVFIQTTFEEGSERKRPKLSHVDNSAGDTDDDEAALTIAEERTLREQVGSY